jgi:hypothetical protein
MELTKTLSGNVTTTLTIGNSYRTRNINKNMTFPNHQFATAIINQNDTQQLDPFPPAISLAYSGYKGMRLAPWLTGIIFALVVFVILIPAFCSACYHYYR